MTLAVKVALNTNTTNQPSDVEGFYILANGAIQVIMALSVFFVFPDSIPDYEELEDDFDISWRIKKEPSPESIHHELDALIHRGK